MSLSTLRLSDLRRTSALLLVLGGLGATVHGLWMPAKATLAQVLLSAAWERSDGERAVRPWPWADTWPVLRLRVPELGIDQVVLEGASGSVLAFAPGRDASPEPGHTVVGGHRDTHFAFLPRLEVGRRIELESPDGRVQVFRVAWTAVVDYRDVGILETGIPEGDVPEAADPPTTLTLVTCEPGDGGPWRLVVRAVAHGQGGSGTTRTSSPSG